MSAPIEDYALIGDCETAALVSRDGSIDWLPVPRFDSHACFAALLGTEDHGFWRLRPVGEVTEVRRQYRGDTLVLETEFTTPEGAVRLVDWMPVRDGLLSVNRLVVGVRGRVEMAMDLSIRFVYGSAVPWVHRVDEGLLAVAGPDALLLRTPVGTHGEGLRTVARFVVEEGAEVPFVLSWFPSNESPPPALDVATSLQETERWWQEWGARCGYHGPWRGPVIRSFITLKALTYAPTGGIVAAPTTSLPEQIGGARNWDYRYCWLRDATFALYALVTGGYFEEMRAWEDWLLRAVAGAPSQVAIMYGLAGERMLTEYEAPWLPGYEGSQPVRIGNAAYAQRQLDVFGEVMDSLHTARQAGLGHSDDAWHLQRALMDYLERIWRQPDYGIWEVRGKPRHFTYSKVMAWVAFDRAVKACELHGLDGPVDRWRTLRDQVHQEVCERGYNPATGTFTQSYDSTELDASLLLIPLVGFLPATDSRMRRTIEAIQRDLTRDGFVYRYRTESGVDGLPAGEGAFLACTLWLADNLILLGDKPAAREIFRRVLGVANDVGLLAEEFDVVARRQVGNFPQAFSHVGLVNTARNLAAPGGPAERRPT
ncbi:MAG: glycoside hydrolase family 15 protein [Dehalococcoidia bacterium]|nr:glycoside hydrolase family 15 protein [Dehalococcoidia bacterium]